MVLLESLTQKVDDRIVASNQWRRDIELLLRGDGNGYHGVVVRLDRVEQYLARVRWVVRTLVGAVLALGAAAMFA